MKKVPVTYVDLYDVTVWLAEQGGASSKLEFQAKELQFYPTGDVLTWMAVTGEVFTVNVRNLLYVRQTPVKTHIEEVEVP
jgi:hypothetical protein